MYKLKKSNIEAGKTQFNVKYNITMILNLQTKRVRPSQ